MTLIFTYTIGQTVTARVRNASGQYWHVATSAFEAYAAGGHAASSYDVTMTGSGAGFTGTFPTGITTAGDYNVEYWDSTITDTPVGYQDVYVRAGTAYNFSGLIGLGSSGAGNYAVALTIRTAAGVALAGARVWLSTDGVSSNNVSGSKTTDNAGLVTFYCDYTTYYVHCHLAGYTFAAASFTAAAGSVTFTKDIATAIVTGSASDYATAFLVRYLALVQKKANEPTINKKFSDDYLIERAEEVFALVLGEKQRQEQDPIVATIEITVVDGQNDYVLPACFGPIQAVYYDSGQGTKWFYRRGSSYNPCGQGVWVEGNLLRLQDSLIAYGETITVEAWPTGTARLHCGVCTINADGDEVTLGATPYLGTLDKSINAYLGSILRIINVTGTSPTGNCIQQCKITSYNWSTRVATLAAALSPIPAAGAGGYIYYEIAPQIPITLDAIIGYKVAADLLSGEGLPKKADGCLRVYQANLRHLRLSAFASQLPSAGLSDADTFQNAAYGGNY